MKSALVTMVCLFAACGADAVAPEPSDGRDPQWVEDLLSLDPTLGGADLMLRRLREDPSIVWPEVAEIAERDRRLAEGLREEEVAARRFLRERVDAELAAAALQFLRSDAGRAAAQGELMALAGAHFQDGESFRDGVLGTLCDPSRVGSHAKARFGEARNAVQSHRSSVSPNKLAWGIAGMLVSPEQAPQIAAFYDTDAGKRWLDVRADAVVNSRAARRRVFDALCGLGWAKSKLEVSNLALPRADFDDGK